MDLLPEGAGEEICQWEKWSERTCWAHIRLWFRWCQGLHWEDTRVRKSVETSALMQTVLSMFFLPIAHPAELRSYLLITNINVVEELESIRPGGAMSSLVCVTAGMPVGWRPSPRTTLWSWPAAWTSGSLPTRAPAHSAALPSYCRTDPAMPRPAEWEPSRLKATSDIINAVFDGYCSFANPSGRLPFSPAELGGGVPLGGEPDEDAHSTREGRGTPDRPGPVPKNKP